MSQERAEPCNQSPERLARVIEVLTNGLFRLRLPEGREVVAHIGMNLRMAHCRLLPGDSVVIDVSPYDQGKARISRLLSAHLNSQRESPPIHPNQRELS